MPETNNEEVKEEIKEKTPEQIKREKFYNDPDRFIDMDDIAIAYLHKDGRNAHFIGSKSFMVIDHGLNELRYEVDSIRTQIRMEAAMKKKEESKIITPK